MHKPQETLNNILQEKVLNLIENTRQQVRSDFILEAASAKTAELVKMFQELPEGYQIYPMLWTAVTGKTMFSSGRNSNLAPAIKIAKDFGFIEPDGMDGNGKLKYKRTGNGLIAKPATPAE